MALIACAAGLSPPSQSSKRKVWPSCSKVAMSIPFVTALPESPVAKILEAVLKLCLLTRAFPMEDFPERPLPKIAMPRIPDYGFKLDNKSSPSC